jgi:hypothetical protein
VLAHGGRCRVILFFLVRLRHVLNPTPKLRRKEVTNIL